MGAVGAVGMVRVVCTAKGMETVEVDGEPLPSWLGKPQHVNVNFDNLIDREELKGPDGRAVCSPPAATRALVTLTCENGDLTIRAKRIEYQPWMEGQTGMSGRR